MTHRSETTIIGSPAYREGHRQAFMLLAKRLRRRANDLRSQQCNTLAHEERCSHAAAVIDQLADELEESTHG